MPAYRTFGGKRYRKAVRGFASKRMANAAAKKLRQKGDVFVRVVPYKSARLKRQMYGIYFRTK